MESVSGGILDGLSITNHYDALLRRTNISSADYSVDYGYDLASRLKTVSGGTNSATYAYLANSPLIESVTFKNGGNTRMVTTKGYDFLNRLTNIVSTTNGVAVASYKYQYNNASQRTRVTEADGSFWVYLYDSLGQVISGRKYWSDSTPVAGQQFEYGFDDIGNRKSAASGGDEWGGNLRTASYTANELNQYTERTVPSFVDVLGSARSDSTVTVNGQLASRKGAYFRAEIPVDNVSAAALLDVDAKAVLNNGSNPDLVASKTGNLIVPQTPENFSYDADGNLTGDGRWTYAWDAENRLLSMESKPEVPESTRKRLNFAYDYQGRRIQKIVSDWNGSSYVPQSTNKFLYDGWNLIAVLASESSILQSFVWGLDLSGSMQGAGGVGGLLAVNDSGATYVVAYDGSGNVTRLVEASNSTISATYEYNPFGEPIRVEGEVAKSNPFRFSTKFQDGEDDLLHYGFRYYQTSTGKWLSRDPIGERGGRNLHAFNYNCPINFIDRDGRDSVTGIPTQLQTNGFGPRIIKQYALECKCKCYIGPRRPLTQDLREEFPSIASIADFSYASGPSPSSVAVGNTYEIQVPAHGTVYVQTTSDVYEGDGFEFTTLQGHFESGTIKFVAKEINDGTSCNVFFVIASDTKSSDVDSYLRYTAGGMGSDMYGRFITSLPVDDMSRLDPKGSFYRGAEYWAQTLSWIGMLRSFAKRHCGSDPKISVSDHWVFPEQQGYR